MEMKLKPATVIDINDTTQKGLIQVKVLPEMKNVSNSLLPWARPFFGTGNASTMTKKVPIVNSNIWVLCDPYYQEIYYLGQYNIKGFVTWNTINSILSNASEISNTDYQNINFKLLADGSLKFNNLSTGDLGIIHNTGSYTIYDNEGNIYIHPTTGKKLFIENGTNNLHTILSEMQAILKNLVTPLKLTAPNGPVTYSEASSDLPTAIALESKIDDLLGEA